MNKNRLDNQKQPIATVADLDIGPFPADEGKAGSGFVEVSTDMSPIEIELTTIQPKSSPNPPESASASSPLESKTGNNMKTTQLVSNSLKTEKVKAGKETPTGKDVKSTIPTPFVSDDASPIVVAVRAYQADRASQMSFEKGDTIKVVDDSSRWHKGVLLTTSGSHPCDGTVLLFPPTYVRVPADRRTSISTTGTRDQKLRQSSPVKRRSVSVKRSSGSLGKGSRVQAKSNFKAAKDSQMSFHKGDIIEV